MQTYRDLIVWQKAMSLVLKLYTETKGFPKEETFGLTSQIQRSVVSVPAISLKAMVETQLVIMFGFYRLLLDLCMSFKPNWKLVPNWDI
jgi:hypothetical protein